MVAVPFLMIPEVIRAVVKKGRAGAYILGEVENGIFCFKYVGRSDRCLQTRLLTHEYLYVYSYFIFRYADNAEEAFGLEAKWWHDCQNKKIPLINRIHPDSPSGAHLVCPYCHFSQGIKELLPFKKAS